MCLAAYVAGKHGIIGLSKSAALDYAAGHVRINEVARGLILVEGGWMAGAAGD